MDTLTISNEEVEELASVEDACNEFILLASKLREKFEHLGSINRAVDDDLGALYSSTGFAISAACAVTRSIEALQRRVIGISE